ncbi:MULTISPECIES: tellurite resistance TerB family protein [Oceanimonas]|uniref:Tellurite resistance TerB family protein n=1 Tax=Oceanimonas smirnovii TaxID=264574 RepID=A0ABW7NYF7_9GAMM|nr:tellurite resistance TerB family protein [Oceanimonas smirnovii]
MDAEKLMKKFLGGSSGFGKGAATGGILGAVLGSKKGRKMAGSGIKYAGLAAAGVMAWKAYQSWQQGKQPEQAAPVQREDFQRVDPRFSPTAPAAGGEPFQLSLMRAMIGAAKADGHVDATEQQRIFEQVEQLGLAADEKALVFDMLSAEISINDIVASAKGPEQAAELYLASRLVMDPDEASERVWLEALAHRLQLPGDLVAHLEQQAKQELG